MQSLMFEAYECGDCARVYLVECGSGNDTVCPVCESPDGTFVGLFEIQKVEKTATAASAGTTGGGQ